jgi:tripartite-type tricarboxylate transporter receptor subunit TctC
MKFFPRGLTQITATLAALFFAGHADAQQFPSKAITIISPFAAGGLLDATLRSLAEPMSKTLGQPIIVDTRPGASTIIAMQACAKAQPDGHTLCATTPDSLSYNPYLFSKLPYDPEHDFVPVTSLVFPTSVVVANASAPFNTMKEMAAYAKANPGKITFGTWGVGSTPDVYGAAMKREFGIDFLHIPYKGAALTLMAVVAGEIAVTYGGLGLTLPYIRSGKLKALATTPGRSNLLPDVPSMKDLGAEPGLPTYFGLFAPAKTPSPAIEKLAAAVSQALQTPQVQDYLKQQIMEPGGAAPADFAKFVKTDRANAGAAFKAMGLKPLDSQ